MHLGFTLLVDASTADLPLPDLDEPGVEVWRDLDGSVAAAGFTRGDRHAIHVPTIGTFDFSATAPEVRLTPLSGASAESVQDAYHRIVLPLAAQLRGRQVLHASAVLTDRGVVALCGRSGAGKSTLAYGLSRLGAPLWGDDAVAFTGSADGFVVDPLPFRIRLRPASAEWFEDPEHQKGAERSQPWDGGSTPRPFSALFVLERTDAGAAAAEIDRLEPADAFTAVLPHAYYLALSDRVLNRSLLTSYLDLADRLPVYRLRYTPRLDLGVDIAAAIHDTALTL